MNKLKFNVPYLKKWAKTVVNKGENYSEYDNKMPIDWNINHFSNWFIDHAVNHATIANSFTEKVFGIPSGTKLIDFFETKENAGSGLNANKYWNKYGSIKSALYDVWEFLKPKLGGSKNESRNNMKKTRAVALVESIVRRALKKKRRSLTEASLEQDPLRAYIQTALWSSTGDDDENLDANYDYNDLSNEAKSQAKKDLAEFIKKVKAAGLMELYLEEYDLSQLAHDFWLTRNGHGAGFWDRSYSNDAPDGSDLGDAITKIAKPFREVDLYVGDDGKLYFS